MCQHALRVMISAAHCSSECYSSASACRRGRSERGFECQAEGRYELRRGWGSCEAGISCVTTENDPMEWQGNALSQNKPCEVGEDIGMGMRDSAAAATNFSTGATLRHGTQQLPP